MARADCITLISAVLPWEPSAWMSRDDDAAAARLMQAACTSLRTPDILHQFSPSFIIKTPESGLGLYWAKRYL